MSGEGERVDRRTRLSTSKNVPESDEGDFAVHEASLVPCYRMLEIRQAMGEGGDWYY